MDAYALTRATGELPWHQVGRGEPGNRVRAMAQLDGPDHDVFVALEVPHGDAIREHLDASFFAYAQADAEVSTDPTVDPTQIVPCLSDDCMCLIPGVFGRVSFIGEPDSNYAFVLADVDGPLSVLAEIAEELGPDRVAAVTDGQRVLVELVGSDRAELDTYAQRLTSFSAVRSSTVSFSKGISRAAP